MRSLLVLVLILLGTTSFAESADRVVFPENINFIPTAWTKEPIQAEFKPLPKNHRLAALGILEKAFAKYPESMLKRYLTNVAVVQELRFYGVAYGGTYVGETGQVILVYRPVFEARGFEQRFHHEFSSILLSGNLNMFSSERWTAANSPGVPYRTAGVIEQRDGDRSESTNVLAEAQKDGAKASDSLLLVDPDLMKLGFLTRYNQVSIEQDVNELAAHLFTDPEIWDYCRRYPRIDQKVHVLIDFYQRLDPSLDRIFFRRLTINPTASPEP